MKRRVLRQHVNKKALRTFQAVHRLKEPFHILLDETFLRSIVAPLRSSSRDNGGGGEKRTTLHQLFADTFGSCVLNILPETLVALERHQHVDAVELASHSCQVAASGGSTPVGSGVSVPSADQSSASAGQQRRNEHKAIVAAVSSAHTSKQFFFVATQSHDLRRQLPTGGCGLVRASFQPLALWIEECCGVASEKGATPAHKYSHHHTESGGGAAAHNVSHSRKPNLSPADTAFMKSIGIDPEKQATRFRRTRQRTATWSSVPPCPLPSAPSGKGTTPPALVPSGGDERDGSASKREKFSRRRIKGPNPLSVKKRSTRETLCVVEEEEPPRHKRRSDP